MHLRDIRTPWLAASIALPAMFTWQIMAQPRPIDAEDLFYFAKDGVICMICVQSQGWHVFLGDSQEICEDPDDCPVNNCDACGGTSSCHEDPWPGDCHLPCSCPGDPENDQNLTLEDIGLIRSSIDQTDVMELRRILEAHPNHVIVNVSRAAVQVLDCRGVNVIAHFPASSTILASLTD